MKNPKRARSLTNKSLTQFLICAAIAFLLSAPLFYLLTKNFYAEEMVDVINAMQQGGEITSLDLEQDIMVGMMLQFVLIFIVLCVSLLITLRFITRRLWHPFDDTLQKTERFNLAQDEVPAFMPTDILEFARLNDSLKKLMEKDRKTYRIQKEFTENASHELQTPIAIMRSKLDLLMQEQMTELQMGIVSSLYDQNTRMGHLNRSLLLLAKIENAQYSEMQEIEIAAFIRRLLPSYEVLLHALTISFHDSCTMPATVRTNEMLFESLLNNLVINAIRHTSTADGKIELSLSDHLLTVGNPSDGHPLDEQALFQRFHTSADSSSGNGIGLAIVKAICNFHGWTVRYDFQDGKHIFKVGW